MNDVQYGSKRMLQWIARVFGCVSKTQAEKHDIRLCAQAVSVARKALIVAIEQEKRLQAKHDKVSSEIDGFDGDKSLLSSNINRLRRIQTLIAAERAANLVDLSRMRETVRVCEQRLQILKRAPRNGAGSGGSLPHLATIAGATQVMAQDAEAILRRLRSRPIEV